jgi:hypothetical protein
MLNSIRAECRGGAVTAATKRFSRRCKPRTIQGPKFSTTSCVRSQASGHGGALKGIRIIDLTRALAVSLSQGKSVQLPREMRIAYGVKLV